MHWKVKRKVNEMDKCVFCGKDAAGNTCQDCLDIFEIGKAVMAFSAGESIGRTNLGENFTVSLNLKKNAAKARTPLEALRKAKG